MNITSLYSLYSCTYFYTLILIYSEMQLRVYIGILKLDEQHASSHLNSFKKFIKILSKLIPNIAHSCEATCISYLLM